MTLRGYEDRVSTSAKRISRRNYYWRRGTRLWVGIREFIDHFSGRCELIMTRIYIYQINISTEGSCIQACDQTTWRGDASCGILGRPIDLVGYESPTAAMTAGPKLCADIFDFSFFLFF